MDRTRQMWQVLETINAVTYFAPECRTAPVELGLKGFWMGYFACRAAPMGPVTAGVVEATFYNFHPARVRRAIPDAWAIADPAAVLDLRARAAAAAIRRLVPSAEAIAADARPRLQELIDAASPAGRPLFAANRDVSPPSDPVAALWQAATTLREQRGDAHVSLLAAAGLDGCEVHALFAAATGTEASLYMDSRGWSAEDWQAASARLEGRGLVRDGSLTPSGRELREHVERRTDELSVWSSVTDDDLIDVLRPAARLIAAAGEIRYPNPMGLPAG
jgi:hypothetical protein